MKRVAEPTVYIVDDDAEFGSALQMLLATAGFRVCVFQSPRAFLRKLRPADPGCILLDMRMPDLSGFQVQAALTRRGFRQPVLFLSGHGDIPMAVRATRAGAVDFIEKPLRDDVLLSKVRQALQLDTRNRRASGAQDAQQLAVSCLSSREAEVGRYLVLGLSSAQMAERMGLSRRTVEMHRSRLLRRLGVQNTAQAVRLLLEAHPAAARAAAAAVPEGQACPPVPEGQACPAKA